MSLLNEPVHKVECYPYQEVNSNFIAFAGDSTLKIHSYEIDRQNDDVECRFTKTIADIHTTSRVDAMAFAPLSATGSLLTLCTVHNDKSLQVYQYNGHEMEKKLDIPTVHDFDINDIAIVTSRTGDIRVATVSDDKTCRLLSLLTTESIPQKFASSVVAVDSAQDKLLVGEQNGQLHMFDLRQDTNTTAIKFHTEKPEPVLEQEDEFSIGFGNTTKPIAPLRDAHIHPLNEHLVGGVAGNHYFLWDLRNPGTTLDHNVAHMPGAKHFRWAPTNDHTFATASGFDTIKIWKANNGKNASLLQTHKQDYRVGGLAWTNYKVGNDEDVLQAKKSEPLCCVSGGDRKLHFYVTF